MIMMMNTKNQLLKLQPRNCLHFIAGLVPIVITAILKIRYPDTTVTVESLMNQSTNL